MIEMSRIEKGLDFLGYIPVVSTYSGLVRITMAKVQIAVGAIGILGAGFGRAYYNAFYINKPLDFNERLKGIKQVHENSIDNLTQGMANFVRGYVEIHSWIGNALVLGYDYAVDYWFQRRKVFAIASDITPRPLFNEDIAQNALYHAKQTVNTAKMTVNYAIESVQSQWKAWQTTSLPPRRDDLPESFSA